MKKINYLILFVLLLFVSSTVYAVEYSYEDDCENNCIGIGDYIIGTAMLTDEYVQANDISTEILMLSSTTISESKLADMKMYYYLGYGYFYEIIGDESYDDLQSTFNITMVNGECVDPICLSGEAGTVHVTFDNVYGVNFNGSAEDVEVDVKYGNAIAASDVPKVDTRPGYKFTCFMKEDEDECFDFSRIITADITLVDVWEAITYNITYDVQGGTATGIPSSITCNALSADCITPNVTPEKEGYTFAGWGVDTDSGLVGINSEITPLLGLSPNITLKAMWNLNEYEITYLLEGGSISTAELVRTYNILKTSIDLVEPTRVGYTFGGWVASTTTIGAVTVNGLEATVNSLEPITFVAQWTPITYSVSFNLESGALNGNSSIAALECTYDEGCTVPSGTPEKVGFEFINWIDDVKHYVYNPGDSITHITSDMTLKAQYTNEHLLSINYNLDGGTFAGNPNITFSKGTKPALTNPTKDGYNFSCWMIGTTCVDDNQTFTESITVTAKWTAKTFKVSYDLNGGSVANASEFTQKTVNYNVGVTVPTTEPTLADHVFYGWEASDGYLYKGGDTVIYKLSNVTLTAKYDLKEKNTISYLLNGGTFANEVITSYGDNASFVLPTPTRVGYTFAGWKDGDVTYPDGTNISTINKANLTITAQWTPISFTLSYNALPSETVVPNTTGCTYESCTITSVVPELEAKEFEGWYYDGYLLKTGERTSLAGVAVENGSTVVLTARWSNKERFFISYLLEGGTFAGNPVTSFYAGDASALAIPTREGYNFTGWVISGTSTTVTNLSELNGDTTLAAQWTEKTFDVIYDKNSTDATFAGTNSTGCTYSEGCAVTDVVPVWPGHTFNGWLAGGETYAAGTVINHRETNITLVADWSEDSYTVTFIVPNDVTLPENVITSLHYGDNELPVLTRVGYNFTGWKDQNEVLYLVDNGTVTATGVDGDRTFTAQWAEKQFTLHFVIDPLDSNDEVNNVTLNYFQTYTFDSLAQSMNIVNLDGTVTLVGWSLNGDLYQLNDTITELEGDVYLTAVWSNRTTHSITYDTDGGNLPTGAITTFYEGINFSLPEPTRDDYEFAGWTDGTETYSTTDILNMDHDLSVTALWTEI